jgi:tRNA threonylcarbamoyladenosine biosynthesis protein TsaE
MYSKFPAHYKNLSLKGLEKHAKNIQALLSSGIPVLFFGPLGVGKTTFIRMILQILNPSILFVPSPSFSLMYSYDTPIGTLWHMDLYRLKDANELEELGTQELMENNLCLIEWPEILEKHLPAKFVSVNLGFHTNINKRIFTIDKNF